MFIGETSAYLDVALVAWPLWPGYTRGFEVSVIDAVALALILSGSRRDVLVPGTLVFFGAVYLGSVVLSSFFAATPTASLFYAWQLLRVYFVFYVVLYYLPGVEHRDALVLGLLAGLTFQASVICWQKAVVGVFQAPGLFAHQNTLGMASHFLLPLVARFFSGQNRRLGMIALMSLLVVSVGGLSRATIASNLFGVVLIYSYCLSTNFTTQKIIAGCLALFLVVLIAPFLMSGLFQRADEMARLVGYDERAAFELVSEMIVLDNPFGIGANNYVSHANINGYMDLAGVAPRVESRSTPVHNTYLLTMAELGYHGLVVLGLFCFAVLTVLLGHLRRITDSDTKARVFGFLVCFVAVFFHSLYEWITLTAGIQYLFAVSLALALTESRNDGLLRVSSKEEQALFL
ncbi:MAG: hypothetical protein AAF918_05400 [Pseudomonadota bacterium]